MKDAPPDPVQLWSCTPVHGNMLPNAEALNPRVLRTFSSLGEQDFKRRTHFFGGRFENLYLERERIPELAAILDHAEICARQILDYGPAPLRCGFWLNAQGPGQATSEHTHQEDDELLSCVYYLSAPPRSADLVFLDGHFTVRVTPVAGMFLFFPPDLPHRVETNRSPKLRLSLAANFGPADDPRNGS